MKKYSLLNTIITLLLVISFITLVIMRDTLPRDTFILLMFILVDIYALYGLNSLFDRSPIRYLFFGVYVLLSIYGYYGLVNGMQRWRTEEGVASAFDNFTIGFAFTLLVSKFFLIILFVIQDIGRVIIGMGQGVASMVSDYNPNQMIPSRRKAITAVAAGIASIPFLSMLYGITKGKYNYTVERIKLSFNDLPKSFEGMKLVQISDIHSGSWDSVESVAEGMQIINDLKPDMIVFTGDLVNESKEEINPYMHLMASLEAPMGKYAVLGNHDYYGAPRDHSLRPAYWQDFYSKYTAMGFDLILNDNRTITKEGEAFKLIGVENWGAGRWFPKKGDLDTACEGCADEEFAILLSHDPTHFDEHVVNHRKKVHLTLSGHTHGMQFGINWPGLKWSPVQWRYKKWMGLYEEKDQKLYVNRGFGFLGFPGRVGMWPEITLIELDGKDS